MFLDFMKYFSIIFLILFITMVCPIFASTDLTITYDTSNNPSIEIINQLKKSQNSITDFKPKVGTYGLSDDFDYITESKRIEKLFYNNHQNIVKKWWRGVESSHITIAPIIKDIKITRGSGEDYKFPNDAYVKYELRAIGKDGNNKSVNELRGEDGARFIFDNFSDLWVEDKDFQSDVPTVSVPKMYYAYPPIKKESSFSFYKTFVIITVCIILYLLFKIYIVLSRLVISYKDSGEVIENNDK